jgi:hypothetical protein
MLIALLLPCTPKHICCCWLPDVLPSLTETQLLVLAPISGFCCDVADDKHNQLLDDVYCLFSRTNPLHVCVAMSTKQQPMLLLGLMLPCTMLLCCR